jgi:hypothetical protein
VLIKSGISMSSSFVKVFSLAYIRLSLICAYTCSLLILSSLRKRGGSGIAKASENM